jgi:hypothetical protein
MHVSLFENQRLQGIRQKSLEIYQWGVGVGMKVKRLGENRILVAFWPGSEEFVVNNLEARRLSVYLHSVVNNVVDIAQDEDLWKKD